MPHFFISYSHLDAIYVRRLAQALEQEGYSPWVDERIDYGSTWDEEVQRRLDECAAFILVMTPNSSASRWVKNELNRAMRKNKPIFPLLLEGEEPWLAVESIQYVDVRGGKLPDERFYQHLSKYAKPEKPVQEAKPSTAKEPAEETSLPEVTVEKAIIGEMRAPQPEEIPVEQDVPPAETPSGKESRDELIPTEQAVERESQEPPEHVEQASEEKFPPTKIPIETESQAGLTSTGQAAGEEMPPAKILIETKTQADLITEKKAEVRKVPSPRIKKEKKERVKKTKVQKATRGSPANKRKWVTGLAAGSLIVVCLGALGTTVWVFREPLGLIASSEKTATFGQSIGKTPTQSSTVSFSTQTAIPLPGIPITIENAGLVTELRRWGDGGVINQVLMNSTGDRLAVGTSQGVYLFDPVTLEEIFALEYIDVPALAFTKEGNTLAIGLGNYTIEVRTVDNLQGGAIYTLQTTAMVRSLAFNPWGLHLAAGLEDGTIQVWSMEDGSLLDTLEGHENIVTAVVFLDDTQLASASYDGTIRLWQIPAGTLEATLAGPSEEVLSLGFSLGGSRLAAGGADGSIQVWSVPEERMLYQFKEQTGEILSLALNPTNDLLASAGGDGLRLWNLGTSEAEIVGTLEGHAGPVRSVVFNQDGETLFSGGTTDGTVRKWSVDTRSETGRLDQFSMEVLFTALSPGGKTLAQRMGEGSVQLWNIAEGTLTRVLENLAENTLIGFSEDGEYLAAVHPTGIAEWLIADGSLVKTDWDTTEGMTVSTFNPAYDKVAIGFTDGVIRIFNFKGVLLETWGTARSGNAVRLLEYCPDSSLLAAYYEDGSLVIWKETGGEPIVNFSIQDAGLMTALAFFPYSDKLLLLGEDGRLRYLPDDSGGISDLSSLDTVFSIKAVEFSPDGTILAIATNGFEIALVDFETMDILQVLSGHNKEITSLIFVPDNDRPFYAYRETNLLVSTSLDGTTRLWGVEP